MKKLFRFIPLVVIVLFVLGCSNTASVLTVTYAFRQAESTAMKTPAIGGTITDLNTQRKINALEGEFDSAWNCGYAAYAQAAAATPTGGTVTVTGANFQVCLGNAWNYAYQLLATIRTFVPGFLSTVTTIPAPNGMALQYQPITTQTPPTTLPFAPKTKMVL